MKINEDILVSVVIPTYNHAHFLKLAIQSVVNQSYSNLEIIIIDNSSTDNTEEIVKNFNDNRIRFFKINNAGIIAASRNFGIKESRGKWIAFLDSDDFWYPQKIEIGVVNILLDKKIDVCSTDELIVYKSKYKSKIRRLKLGPYSNDFYKKLIIEGNCLSTSATMVSSKFIKDNKIFFREDPRIITVEDYDFWMMLAKSNAIFKFIDSVQGEYLIHEKNLSGQYERHNLAKLNVLKDHVFNYQNFQANKEKLWGQVYARLLLEKSKKHLMEKKLMLAIRDFKMAFHSSFFGSLRYIMINLKKYYF